MIALLDLPLIDEYLVDLLLLNNAMHEINKYIMQLIVIT